MSSASYYGCGCFQDSCRCRWLWQLNNVKPGASSGLCRWHDFLCSLADNMVEVNWMLVVTLIPVMVGTYDIVAMFGLTDTVWVVSGFY